MSDGCSKHKYKADAIHCETCAAWASAEYNQKRAETAEAEIEKLMADAALGRAVRKMKLGEIHADGGMFAVMDIKEGWSGWYCTLEKALKKAGLMEVEK